MANNALDDMGVVGDVIDKHTTTGPLDEADDAPDETEDELDHNPLSPREMGGDAVGASTLVFSARGERQ